MNLLLCALKSIFININHVGGGGVQFFKIIGEVHGHIALLIFSIFRDILQPECPNC